MPHVTSTHAPDSATPYHKAVVHVAAEAEAASMLASTFHARSGLRMLNDSSSVASRVLNTYPPSNSHERPLLYPRAFPYNKGLIYNITTSGSILPTTSSWEQKLLTNTPRYIRYDRTQYTTLYKTSNIFLYQLSNSRQTTELNM